MNLLANLSKNIPITYDTAVPPSPTNNRTSKRDRSLQTRVTIKRNGYMIAQQRVYKARERRSGRSKRRCCSFCVGRYASFSLSISGGFGSGSSWRLVADQRRENASECICSGQDQTDIHYYIAGQLSLHVGHSPCSRLKLKEYVPWNRYRLRRRH